MPAPCESDPAFDELPYCPGSFELPFELQQWLLPFDWFECKGKPDEKISRKRPDRISELPCTHQSPQSIGGWILSSPPLKNDNKLSTAGRRLLQRQIWRIRKQE